jgi:hypothetical protein
MPSSFLSDSAAPWRRQPQIQQQPNQGPASSSAPSAAEADPFHSDGDEDSGLGGGPDDDTLDATPPLDAGNGSSDSDDPPAGTAPLAGADPLRAERRRRNQLEKELRKAPAQLARFSEINPDEYARLQEAERKREVSRPPSRPGTPCPWTTAACRPCPERWLRSSSPLMTLHPDDRLAITRPSGPQAGTYHLQASALAELLSPAPVLGISGLLWASARSAADNSWQAVCWSPELRLYACVSNSCTGNRG